MSHLPERSEKKCLNCGAEPLQGRYCHICGQENLEPHESFWQLLTHFVFDIIHFDGKFFVTVKDLALKPGFLPKEYIRGRRQAYLHPIRMYIFISAVFFLFLFSFDGKNNESPVGSKGRLKAELRELRDARNKLGGELGSPYLTPDARAKTVTAIEAIDSSIRRSRDSLDPDPKPNKKKRSSQVRATEDSAAMPPLQVKTTPVIGKDGQASFRNDTFRSAAHFDSFQASLPDSQRVSWLSRKFYDKVIELESKSRADSRFGEEFWEKLKHTAPQALFLSLPFYALALQVLYISRKKKLYTDHLVFSIYLYCATFIILFSLMLISRIQDLPRMNWFGYAAWLPGTYLVYYAFRSLRVFYEQSWLKTAAKFFFLGLALVIIMILILIIAVMFSALTI